jgi:hypothetical protein
MRSDESYEGAFLLCTERVTEISELRRTNRHTVLFFFRRKNNASITQHHFINEFLKFVKGLFAHDWCYLQPLFCVGDDKHDFFLKKK